MIKVDRAKLAEMTNKFNETGLVKKKVEFTDETTDMDLLNNFMNTVEKVPKPKEKSIPKDVATFYNECVDAIEAEETKQAEKFVEAGKTKTGKDAKKADPKKAPESEKKDAKKAETKKDAKKEEPKKESKKEKKESGPSTKLTLYKEFQKGKKSIDDLEKVAGGDVKRSTIRMWVSRWSRKVGIPKGASK